MAEKEVVVRRVGLREVFPNMAVTLGKVLILIGVVLAIVAGAAHAIDVVWAWIGVAFIGVGALID